MKLKNLNEVENDQEIQVTGDSNTGRRTINTLYILLPSASS